MLSATKMELQGQAPNISGTTVKQILVVLVREIAIMMKSVKEILNVEKIIVNFHIIQNALIAVWTQLQKV